MEAKLRPKVRSHAGVGDVDAFCGPCYHNAIEHEADPRRAPLCWECPGSKPDYDVDSCVGGVQRGWWAIPGGDPTLEGWSCDKCAVKGPQSDGNPSDSDSEVGA